MAVSVYIVDDEADVRRMVRLVIESSCDVRVVGEAHSGETAIDDVESVNPDVVLLDQRMPGMSGLETAEAILERRPHQAILLFSASVSSELAALAAALGVTACYAKDRLLRVPELLEALVVFPRRA